MGWNQEELFTFWVWSVSITMRSTGWWPVLLLISLQPVHPASCTSDFISPDLLDKSEQKSGYNESILFNTYKWHTNGELWLLLLWSCICFSHVSWGVDKLSVHIKKRRKISIFSNTTNWAHDKEEKKVHKRHSFSRRKLFQDHDRNNRKHSAWLRKSPDVQAEDKEPADGQSSHSHTPPPFYQRQIAAYLRSLLYHNWALPSVYCTDRAAMLNSWSTEAHSLW